MVDTPSEGPLDKIVNFFKGLFSPSAPGAAEGDDLMSKVKQGFEVIWDFLSGLVKKVVDWVMGLFHSDSPQSQQGLPQNPGTGMHPPGQYQAQSYPPPMMMNGMPPVGMIPMGIPANEYMGPLHSGHCGGHEPHGGGRGRR